MKKLLFFLIATSLFIFLSSIFINSAVIFIAKKELNTIFKGSEVAIGSCRLSPLKQLSLFEISIKDKQAYDFLIKEARVEYNFSSILKSNILKFSLKDAKICINLPQESITAFLRYLNLGPKGVFLVKSLELSNFDLDLKSKDLNVKGILSSQVNLAEENLDSLDIKISSLGFQGFDLNDLYFKAAQGSTEGIFGIGQLRYNKLNISGIKSQVRLSGSELLLKNISAEVFDGNISGNLDFTIDQDFNYGADLSVTNLNIARFIKDFDLKDKIEMTGSLSGNIILRGKGPEIKILNGKLSSLESGGTLIIKDTKFLENMARNTNQSLDLLVENFKNYQYTIGTLKLSLDNSNVVMDIALDGKAGKRKLSVVVHNFKLKKEGE